MINKTKKTLVEAFSDEDVKVYSLGGLGEVGKNMYVLECLDEIMIIDSGFLFPDNAYGVDYVIPDYCYLQLNEKKIIGVFITHGHEDHIGGLPFLLRSVNIPQVYANGLAVELIKNKFRDFPQISVPIKEFNDDSIFTFKHFTISFFRTNHSIPDSFGIAILTKYGYILHTGDFKFDFTPIGQHADYHKLTTYSQKGVRLLLADSTNASVSHFTSSEKKISTSIRSIFSQIKGRIIISTFASNVYRVQQIVEASVASGRKIIVFGRSMEKTVNVAQQLKYIKAPAGTFITAREFPHLPPEKITILSTGSQGEPLAALSRIAEGTHRQIKLIPGDTIVFSSSPIPGNKESVNRTINKLYKAGATVIVNSPLTDTHTSGHASQDELKLMLVLTKPEYFMPIHGEYSMLAKHLELAVSTGVKRENCFIMQNGEVLQINKHGISSKYMVPAGDVYIDSHYQVVDSGLIKERKWMSDDGFLAVIYALDGHQLISTPQVLSRGFIYTTHSTEIINKIQIKAAAVYQKYLDTHSHIHLPSVKNHIAAELTTYINELTERKPVLIPVFLKK